MFYLFYGAFFGYFVFFFSILLGNQMIYQILQETKKILVLSTIIVYIKVEKYDLNKLIKTS